MIVFTRKVDEWVQLGDDLFVGPTDIDEDGVRLLAKGRMLGGPDDGAAFKRAAEVAVGGEMRLGPHVVVTVIGVVGDRVRLGVQGPQHLAIGHKEVADPQRRERHERGVDGEMV
jgi:sRNA-binding carbon storage regulator CsrA